MNKIVISILIALCSTNIQATTNNTINLKGLEKNCIVEIKDHKDVQTAETKNGIIGDYFNFLSNTVINKGAEDDIFVNFFIEGQYNKDTYSYRLVYNKNTNQLSIVSYTINYGNDIYL